MSVHPRPLEPVPAETARIAHLAFPKGNCYLTLRDEIGTLFEDDNFTDLFSNYGQPAISPWQLVQNDGNFGVLSFFGDRQIGPKRHADFVPKSTIEDEAFLQ